VSKRVDLRFWFSETEEDGYTHLELEDITMPETDMTQEQLESIAEMWGQSDDYWTNICWGIIDVIDGTGFDPRR
jgi:hypothetical protein